MYTYITLFTQFDILKVIPNLVTVCMYILKPGPSKHQLTIKVGLPDGNKGPRRLVVLIQLSAPMP